MKLGNLNVKRRYSLIQIIVDIFSAAMLFYIVFIVISCAQTIEQIKELNLTEKDLDFLHWEPLILWIVIGAAVCIVSVFALILPRKEPKKLFVNPSCAPKFCNAVDACISCVRLIILHALSECCYLHMQFLLQQPLEFSIQLVLDTIIIALIIWFTFIRLQGISENAKEEEEEKKKQRHIVEN